MKIDFNKDYYKLSLIPLFLISIILISGCGKPAPNRNFLDSELLLRLSDLPEGWVAAKSTDNGIEKEGAEQYSLRYYQYSLTSYLVKSGEDLYRYKDLGIAYNNYKWFKKYYFSQSSRDVTPWETPSDFQFTSMATERWHFACGISIFSPAPEFGKKRKICTYLAQYDEFVVNFGITIEVDDQVFMTIQDVTKIIETIDQRMSKYLQKE